MSSGYFERNKKWGDWGDSEEEKRDRAQDGDIFKLAWAVSLIALEEKRGHPILFSQTKRARN